MAEVEKNNPVPKPVSRREFIRGGLRGLLLAVLGCFGGAVFARWRCAGADGGKACGACPWLAKCTLPFALQARAAAGRRTVWQLDPKKCIQCGRCAVNCVFQPSAVKCINYFEQCGYCRLCFGYFQPGALTLTSAAENQLCPTGAIRRKFLEEPYYEYTIDESLCIGCGRCVKPCADFGNGSLVLQVRHDLCANCNECSIARRCPSGAYSRVPADQPYLFANRNLLSVGQARPAASAGLPAGSVPNPAGSHRGVPALQSGIRSAPLRGDKCI